VSGATSRCIRPCGGRARLAVSGTHDGQEPRLRTEAQVLGVVWIAWLFDRSPS